MFKSTLAIVFVLLATVAMMSWSQEPENTGAVGNMTTWAVPQTSGTNSTSDFVLFFLNQSPDNETDIPFTLWDVLPQTGNLADRFHVENVHANLTLEIGINDTTTVSVLTRELAVWNVTGLASY